MLRTRLTEAQSLLKLRPCCGEGPCYRRRHLRLLDKVPGDLARRLVTELAGCERGLGREELIAVTLKTAARGRIGLARQSLREMDVRGVRPSITAHNAVLDALARRHRWSECLSLLTMMKQKGPAPDEQSYAAAMRASTAAPLGAQLARQLLPELDSLGTAKHPELSPARLALPARLAHAPGGGGGGGGRGGGEGGG
mmetsp:Transcript_13502/g.43191  ORF Transcript_13502/g.43191 Transcript_13502/m.43191 type:complete len:197 (+) Transcript_13502:49-639(+)